MRLRTILPSLALAATGLFACSAPGAHAADLDCADFSTQDEAQEYLLPGDPHRLDADGDGIACETLPPGGTTGGGDESEPPPPPPPKLDKVAARNAAERQARKFTRRHSRVDSVALSACGRRSRHRVACRFVARGRTATGRTTCRFRVAVRGEGSSVSSARIHGVQCRTRIFNVLSPRRAKRAMEAAAQRIAGTPTLVFAVSRLGPRTFSGIAEWEQTSTAGVEELCSLELTAEQPRSQPIQVRTRERDCRDI